LSRDQDAATVVFYDGVCGLCDRFVRFLLTRDAAGRLRFAQLQGGLARRELTPLGHDPGDLDTVFVIAGWRTPRQRVLARSRAVLHAVGQLGGFWPLLARIAHIVPPMMADVFYRMIARVRYRLFGRFDTCPLRRPEWRDRFLD
jgi:predicted DCC family thiol-disulfide oxidoreductase YuxK